MVPRTHANTHPVISAAVWHNAIVLSYRSFIPPCLFTRARVTVIVVSVTQIGRTRDKGKLGTWKQGQRKAAAGRTNWKRIALLSAVCWWLDPTSNHQKSSDIRAIIRDTNAWFVPLSSKRFIFKLTLSFLKKR